MNQEELKKCIENKYQEYFEFCPYVGDNYSEKKILVILESHYCSSEIDKFGFTIKLFNDWRDNLYPMNATIIRLTEVFDGKIDLWKDICFSNYFQKLIVRGKNLSVLRKSGWSEVTNKSKKAFVSLVKEIEPEIIFCFSTSAYNNMPNQKDISKGMFKYIASISATELSNNKGFKSYKYTIDGREVKVINFAHPLKRHVNWSQ